MAHFAQKSLATAAIILSFLAADLAFAATAKSMKTAQATEDPDLKLSIQELKEKYPPSLLKEKNKTYKSGQKINIDDYSVAEIKAAFLNADENFMSRKSSKEIPNIALGQKDLGTLMNDVRVRNPQELVVIEAACELLGSVVWTKPKKYQIIQSFVFASNEIKRHIYRFVSAEIQNCLFESDPYEKEDRN